ncbi:MAG: hypothetical protein M3O30_06490 [Planctomycetota bacterium]|nr:hypothetical protein [Planctomycetota bacterium]
MEAFFTELGRTILERWKRQNFSLLMFPEIARTALDERPPAKRVDLPAFMRDFLLREDQPFQTDSEFGEPELVVYKDPRFYIQLLFWMDGTTAIHQHEFSGAFHVMHGSSIHAHYQFEKARPVTPYMRVGNLRMKKMEILESGRTVPIVSGQQTIHSLFHLDSPSVTVVVRTHHDPGTGPQYNYLPPHIAIDPLHSDLLTVRRNQLLDVLEQVEDTAYAELVMEMIADLDFERGFFVLQHCMEYLQQLGEWGAAIKALQKKHGALAAGVAATLREEARRNVIKGLRSMITEPEHRFFLALLMNAPTRADLLSLVAQRFPREAPLAVVLRWVEELMEMSDEGVTILDASFPETIEVESEARPDLFLSAFRHFMKRDKKIPPAMRDLSAADVKELRAVFAESALGLLTI